MKLLVIRTLYGPTYTAGVLLLDDSWFAYTLEDALREIKIPGETAIAAGTYTVKVTKSVRFNKNLPQIIDVPEFEGVRFHGGNSALDTRGCILVASRRLSDDSIAGSKSEALTIALAKGEHQLQIVEAWR